MIQILQKDHISDDHFLLPDYDNLKEISNYLNKQIYIGGYPNVIEHKKEKHFSSGVIKFFDKKRNKLLHSSDTRAGSSGSPIINIEKKVVGIHCGSLDIGDEKEKEKENEKEKEKEKKTKMMNYGTFIGDIINELMKEGNIEIINETKPYDNNDNENNSKDNEIKSVDQKANQRDNEQPKKVNPPKEEEEQPKEDTKINIYDQNSYINNIINSSPILTLSKENMAKFGNLLNNPGYMNYVKNYYSNPNVREALKNDQNFQELLKMNPVLKMVYSKPELIDKMFTQEMCNEMSKALLNGKMQEINDVDQKVTNIILNGLNEKKDDNNNE